MIPVLFMMWCLAAPMGFLAGDVFLSRYPGTSPNFEYLPYLAAVFTPLGALIAVVLIVQTQPQLTEKEEDHE